MADEKDKALDAIRMAIQMEIDGREFYTRAAAESRNEAGRKLLETLASEEDVHRRVFTRIFDSIREKKGWPEVDVRNKADQTVTTVLSEGISRAGTIIKPSANELEAVQTARQMEGKTYDYYRAQLHSSTTPAEKEFYESLCAQEQQHGLALADYYEYLRDPAAWFVMKERPHLD